MFRFNNPDALLVLLLTVAAYAGDPRGRAGRTRWLVLAGRAGRLRVPDQDAAGVPGAARRSALAYLVAGPPRLRRRLALLARPGRCRVAAGWWVAVVQLRPAADRPYIGGSTNNSMLELTSATTASAG